MEQEGAEGVWKSPKTNSGSEAVPVKQNMNQKGTYKSQPLGDLCPQHVTAQQVRPTGRHSEVTLASLRHEFSARIDSAPRAHLADLRTFWLSQVLGGVTDISWVEARDGAKHPAYTDSPTMGKDPKQNSSSSGAEKPWSTEVVQGPQFNISLYPSS